MVKTREAEERKQCRHQCCIVTLTVPFREGQSFLINFQSLALGIKCVEMISKYKQNNPKTGSDYLEHVYRLN